MPKAFSLTELLVAVSILTVVMAGMMEVFAAFSILGEMSSKSQIALADAEGKMEEIRSTSFSSIVSNYTHGGLPGDTFRLQSLNGSGSVSIDNSVADLLKVTVSVSFSVRNNRAVSPIVITTYMANR